MDQSTMVDCAHSSVVVTYIFRGGCGINRAKKNF